MRSNDLYFYVDLLYLFQRYSNGDNTAYYEVLDKCMYALKIKDGCYKNGRYMSGYSKKTL